jgi:hypothetical protein
VLDIAAMTESSANLASLQSHEGRQHDRTHMFVAATLYSGAGSCPVQIRNMSLNGALIDGAVLPERGVSATLKRGSMAAASRIVWRAGRKAGIAFDASVHVADWMTRNPPTHQARVDEMVREIRAESSPQEPMRDLAGPAPDQASFEAELSALKDELAQLEHGLTDDPAVVAAHPEIQLLDIALKRVGRLLDGIRR